jgi:hypothetical protein
MSASRTDRILAICAIISAFAAVAIAVYETRITRTHQKASVWPSLLQYNTAMDGIYTREVENRGLGPALVRTFQVSVDGAPVASWNQAIEALTGEIPGNFIYGGLGEGHILLPGRPYRLLILDWELLGQHVHREVNRGRLTTEICYCSLYDDCWVAGSGLPVTVSRCPEPGHEFRQQH